MSDQFDLDQVYTIAPKMSAFEFIKLEQEIRREMAMAKKPAKPMKPMKPGKPMKGGKKGC